MTGSGSRSTKEDIYTDIAEGGVDIVIGTHRLLSSDVKFRDMGLLIIDEEQRFGVTHKEALKKMRTAEREELAEVVPESVVDHLVAALRSG